MWWADKLACCSWFTGGGRTSWPPCCWFTCGRQPLLVVGVCDVGSCLALALLVEMMDQDWILALVVDMGMMKKLTLLVEMMEMS